MVYRCLDPGRDWDAWCDDNQEPPEFDDVPEEFYRAECCGYGLATMPHPRFPRGLQPVIAEPYRCENCGKFCRIDEEASIDNYIKYGNEE